MSAHTNITIAAEGRDATADIQQAIDTASAAGGGVVSLLAGRHVSGGLHLKSGVELHLAQDAVLAPFAMIMPRSESSAITETRESA